MLINIIYKDSSYNIIYKQVTKQEAIKLAQAKQAVTMFTFNHRPTRIAMVALVGSKLIGGKYNG